MDASEAVYEFLLDLEANVPSGVGGKLNMVSGNECFFKEVHESSGDQEFK